ncbi:hypothetical protein EXIGLDRAFT_718165 [Exidia glandulosa HHB12029]|nr:hypothetical protein EXIGLDRAFT_718165 [Exidia glandulosa HHB12029]
MSRGAIPGMGVGVGEGVGLLSLLAGRNVSSSILDRVSRMAPPPAQIRANGALAVYGAGTPAPWNPTPDQAQDDAKAGREPALTPAELYATWPIDSKDFRVATLKKKR